ncbi:cyclin-dependent protein kinase inhibitor SMR13-like [Lycium ferocissimum]|uniref:cyclin-dependent protein kinase inhibitor SMR13-like n=1 Tax=Lycium ferocissimum TaxID=112874 RepID=UPI00281522ED|nr:cyclin-dependent protein kinase inhibitor SMR13-like [Lycium ferocissimum]
MGPSSRKRTRSSRTITQKQQPLKNNEEVSAVSPCKSTSLKDDDINGSNVSNDYYSTPKAEKFRIPDIKTCPPAPKKKRRILFSSSSSSSAAACNTSLKRSPISFFTPLDLDHLFHFEKICT